MTGELSREDIEKIQRKREAEKEDARKLIRSGIGRKGPLEKTGLEFEQAFEDIGNGRVKARGSNRTFKVTIENGSRRITAEDDGGQS